MMNECHLCSFPMISNGILRKHLKKTHDLQIIDYFKLYPEAKKFCSICKLALPVAQFLADSTNNYGYRTACLHCFRPTRTSKACPICQRVMTWQGIAAHIKKEHGIPILEAYNLYLKEKFCPKCRLLKPPNEFSRLQDENLAYFSWCKECNKTRGIKKNKDDTNFTLFDLLLVRLGFEDKCFSCGITHKDHMKIFGAPLEIDHIIPYSQGEVLSLSNALL